MSYERLLAGRQVDHFTPKIGAGAQGCSMGVSPIFDINNVDRCLDCLTQYPQPYSHGHLENSRLERKVS